MRMERVSLRVSLPGSYLGAKMATIAVGCGDSRTVSMCVGVLPHTRSERHTLTHIVESLKTGTRKTCILKIIAPHVARDTRMVRCGCDAHNDDASRRAMHRKMLELYESLRVNEEHDMQKSFAQGRQQTHRATTQPSHGGEDDDVY